jgi:hypothetical protein
MRKWKKAKGAVALAIVILVSAFAAYAFEPTVIYFQGENYEYQKVGSNWITIDQENNSVAKGCFLTVYCQSLSPRTHESFDLIVTLTNATFLDGAQTANVVYNLQDQQQHSTTLAFAVKDGVKTFAIALSLQPQQLFLRGEDRNWDSQNPIPYFLSWNNTYQGMFY